MHAYILDKQIVGKSKRKLAHRVTSHIYYTTGMIDLDHIRNNIPHYQTATVMVDESIVLPTPGIHSIKIKVDQKWHDGIAILNRSLSADNSTSRTIKVFIKDKMDQPEKMDVAIHWYFHIEKN